MLVQQVVHRDLSWQCRWSRQIVSTTKIYIITKQRCVSRNQNYDICIPTTMIDRELCLEAEICCVIFVFQHHKIQELPWQLHGSASDNGSDEGLNAICHGDLL